MDASHDWQYCILLWKTLILLGHSLFKLQAFGNLLRRSSVPMLFLDHSRSILCNFSDLVDSSCVKFSSPVIADTDFAPSLVYPALAWYLYSFVIVGGSFLNYILLCSQYMVHMGSFQSTFLTISLWSLSCDRVLDQPWPTALLTYQNVASSHADHFQY